MSSKKSPTVLSIIIVNFNTAKLTLDCIKSIFEYSPKFTFEVIVVDNASSDESVKELSKNKNIKLIKNTENFGFSKANNVGISASTGKYVFLLNSDTKIINDVLSELVEFAEGHPDAGIVAPKLLNPDKSLQPSIFNLPTLGRAISQYWFGTSKSLDKYGLENIDATVVESVVAAAFLITPKARETVGLLSEKYFMYFEDLDYCRRVNESNLKVYYVPSSSLIHIHGASGKGQVNSLLIASSKQYFGIPLYYLYTFVLWSGQKMRRVF